MTLIKIANKPQNTTKKLFSNLKPVIQLEEKIDTLYKIDCLQCSGSNVGPSGQHLKSRIKNHINDVKNLKETTDLSKHSLETGHSLDFTNVQILSQ